MDCTHSLHSINDQRPHGLYIAEDPPGYTTTRHSSALHGTALRLSAALIEGASGAQADKRNKAQQLKRFCARANDIATDGSVCPEDELGQRLMLLERESHRQLSLQLELITRFAEAGLYRKDGCRSMIHWMDVWLNVGRIAASERLRVGRALRELPVCAALFSLGKLSYSKLRIITRHATPDTDQAFANACLELSVVETEAWCEHYRHDQDDAAIAAANDREAQASLIAFNKRALHARTIDANRTRITIDLPNDQAAEFLKSLEHCDDVLDHVREQHPTLEPTACQRRADAAVLMSRRSLAHAGEAVATADRYRVHVMINASDLAKRPLIDGRKPLSEATAARLATLAGFTEYAVDGLGNPVGSRRKAAPFSRRQRKALRARDGCCQMPGCGATRHLDGHHLIPRAVGGPSTLSNAVLLCGGCHRLLHEGGFSLQRDVEEPQRYRLFDAHGRECGSRGAAFRRSELAALFSRGNSAMQRAQAERD